MVDKLDFASPVRFPDAAAMRGATSPADSQSFKAYLMEAAAPLVVASRLCQPEATKKTVGLVNAATRAHQDILADWKKLSSPGTLQKKDLPIIQDIGIKATVIQNAATRVHLSSDAVKSWTKDIHDLGGLLFNDRSLAMHLHDAAPVVNSTGNNLDDAEEALENNRACTK